LWKCLCDRKACEDGNNDVLREHVGVLKRAVWISGKGKCGYVEGRKADNKIVDRMSRESENVYLKRIT
jgi:hypothetical protein